MKMRVCLIFTVLCLSIFESKVTNKNHAKNGRHHKNSEKSKLTSKPNSDISYDAIEDYINLIEQKTKVIKSNAYSTNEHKKMSLKDETNNELDFMEVSSRSKSRLEKLNEQINENVKTAESQVKIENDLQDKLESLDKEFNDIKTQVALQKKNLISAKAENAITDTLTSKHAVFNTLEVNKLDVGELFINSESGVINLSLTDNIEIGAESITAQNILEMIDFVRQVKSFCGDYFRDCRIISEAEHRLEKNSVKEIKSRINHLNLQYN